MSNNKLSLHIGEKNLVTLQSGFGVYLSPFTVEISDSLPAGILASGGTTYQPAAPNPTTSQKSPTGRDTFDLHTNDRIHTYLGAPCDWSPAN